MRDNIGIFFNYLYMITLGMLIGIAIKGEEVPFLTWLVIIAIVVSSTARIHFKDKT